MNELKLEDVFIDMLAAVLGIHAEEVKTGMRLKWGDWHQFIGPFFAHVRKLEDPETEKRVINLLAKAAEDPDVMPEIRQEAKQFLIEKADELPFEETPKDLMAETSEADIPTLRKMALKAVEVSKRLEGLQPPVEVDPAIPGVTE